MENNLPSYFKYYILASLGFVLELESWLKRIWPFRSTDFYGLVPVFKICCFQSWQCIRSTLPQTQWLKTTHVYHLTISVVQESQHGFTEYSAQDLKLQSGCCLGCVSGGLMGEESNFRFNQIVGRIHIFVIGCNLNFLDGAHRS